MALLIKGGHPITSFSIISIKIVFPRVKITVAKNNPYINRLDEFQGRIFSFYERPLERDAIWETHRAFNNIICEIGSGSGMHLISFASQNPETCCFGIELRYKRAVRTIEKAQKLGVENLFILRTDARLISKIFSANSLSGIFINYPDPWAKRCEQKHRILRSEFLSELEKLLIPHGFLSVKTDHHEYFEFFTEEIAKIPQFKSINQTNDLYKSSYLGENIPTEFEKLFHSQNLPLCYAKYEKLPL